MNVGITNLEDEHQAVLFLQDKVSSPGVIPESRTKVYTLLHYILLHQKKISHINSDAMIASLNSVT